MFASEQSFPEQWHALEARLGLWRGEQDWGMESADAERVSEFVSFFASNFGSDWLLPTVAEFVDLVMESASDALRADSQFELGVLDPFVAITSSVVPDRYAYWVSDDWPVAPYLRSLGIA